MKLTKEHIKHIDEYLKNQGVIYWDVRLEMVDHLVSDIENYSGSADFKTVFNRSLQKANWDKNLKDINTQSWKSTNKIYRKLHSEEMINLLKQPKSLIGFILFYDLLNRIAVLFPENLKIAAFIISGVPLLILIYELIKSWRRRLGKSVNMQYGIFYFSFGLIMTNPLLQLIPKSYMNTWLPLVLTLYLVMMTAGYRVYKCAFKKALKLKGID